MWGEDRAPGGGHQLALESEPGTLRSWPASGQSAGDPGGRAWGACPLVQGPAALLPAFALALPSRGPASKYTHALLSVPHDPPHPWADAIRLQVGAPDAAWLPGADLPADSAWATR